METCTLNPLNFDNNDLNNLASLDFDESRNVASFNLDSSKMSNINNSIHTYVDGYKQYIECNSNNILNNFEKSLQDNLFERIDFTPLNEQISNMDLPGFSTSLSSKIMGEVNNLDSEQLTNILGDSLIKLVDKDEIENKIMDKLDMSNINTDNIKQSIEGKINELNFNEIIKIDEIKEKIIDGLSDLTVNDLNSRIFDNLDIGDINIDSFKDKIINNLSNIDIGELNNKIIDKLNIQEISEKIISGLENLNINELSSRILTEFDIESIKEKLLKKGKTISKSVKKTTNKTICSINNGINTFSTILTYIFTILIIILFVLVLLLGISSFNILRSIIKMVGNSGGITFIIVLFLSLFGLFQYLVYYIHKNSEVVKGDIQNNIIQKYKELVGESVSCPNKVKQDYEKYKENAKICFALIMVVIVFNIVLSIYKRKKNTRKYDDY